MSRRRTLRFARPIGLTPRVGLTALAALAILQTACPAPPERAAPDGPLDVVVSVPPQAYFLERIAGHRVRTTVLLSPGTSPEIASLSPRQRVALTRADLVVLVGHPAFAFEQRHVLPVLERHPELSTVSMAEALDLPETPSPDRHSHHGAGDPHVWVAPRLVNAAAGSIADTLSRVDPGGAPIYRRRLEGFRAEIDALDREIRRELDRSTGDAFLTYHPAWGHFAAQYGLEQMAIEEHGKEPSSRHLVQLIEEARRREIRTIFAQGGLPQRGAEAVAEEIGARVVTLDPLARDWPGTLRKLARAVGGRTARTPDETSPPPAEESREYSEGRRGAGLEG